MRYCYEKCDYPEILGKEYSKIAYVCCKTCPEYATCFVKTYSAPCRKARNKIRCKDSRSEEVFILDKILE